MKTGAGKNSGGRALSLSIILVLVLLFNCTSSQPKLEQYSLHGTTMGTIYSIKIVAAKELKVDSDAIQTEIDALLIKINQVMSTYISDSELSCLNLAPPGQWIPVSQELMTVLHAAQGVSERSGGAFDVTVGPLVNLWGFGPEKRSDALPDAQEIVLRKEVVGYQKLALQTNTPAVLKAISKMYCDLSAIAKGYGVDRVAGYIELKGFANYMVEIGGEVRVRGHNASGESWRIGISSPQVNTVIQKVVSVKDQSIATSGDYRNYYEKEGVRYSHTINPVTGRPITHKLASVSVLHASCMMADAFATAINVLGPEAGMKLAEQENLPVFMVVKNGDGFTEVMNPAFAALIRK